MTAIGVFEADANANKLSVEAAANNGFEFEKSVDRAIFRAKERFGAYLANSQGGEFYERFAQIKPEMIRVIAEVMTPTPGVIRRVGAALRPPALAQALAKKDRPSSAKTAGTEKERRDLAYAHRDEVVLGSGVAIEPKDFARVGSTQKLAWGYDQSTKLYTSNDPMQKFACPGCGTEQDSLGFIRCAGANCGRTWNSWPVRQASSGKTSAAAYVLMAREIKMRGDQFKMAATGNVKVADGPMPMMQQPNAGTMPGDNSAAMGSPMPAEQPPTPMAAAGDADHDGDVAGGITEGSPIDQIQDALEGAVVALKDVQMLSINPVLAKTASTKVKTLRTAMDRFWGLHKQLDYVAGMLAKEANEAIRASDPRITAEAQFVKGFEAAAKNESLPTKAGRAYLEGYVAFHKQAETTPVDADYGPAKGVSMDHLTEPEGKDTTNGARNDGSFLAGGGLDDAANTMDSDAGPFDSSQPAQQDSARQIDQDNAAGNRDRGQGDSGSIQPTGARRRR